MSTAVAPHDQLDVRELRRPVIGASPRRICPRSEFNRRGIAEKRPPPVDC